MCCSCFYQCDRLATEEECLTDKQGEKEEMGAVARTELIANLHGTYASQACKPWSSYQSGRHIRFQLNCSAS
jgi:hypothetical protein